MSEVDNDKTEAATLPRMPTQALRADFVNAACRRDRQQAEVAKARTVLRGEEQRLAILEEAEAEFYAAMVTAAPAEVQP